MPKSKKQFCQATRSRKSEPVIEKRERINKAVFMRIVSALRDARPIRTSEHFPYKDSQHKECVYHIAKALGTTVRGKTVSLGDYIDNFMHIVRGEF